MAEPSKLPRFPSRFFFLLLPLFLPPAGIQGSLLSLERRESHCSYTLQPWRAKDRGLLARAPSATGRKRDSGLTFSLPLRSPHSHLFPCSMGRLVQMDVLIVGMKGLGVEIGAYGGQTRGAEKQRYGCSLPSSAPPQRTCTAPSLPPSPSLQPRT